MHILITDSGVGGLSVVAYAERFIRENGFSEPVRLTFANAAPANDYGYNSMPSRDAKIETFDRFLRNVAERYAPDMIYVACNTLSVLLPDTPFFRSGAVPVKGIVETGVEVILSSLASGEAARTHETSGTSGTSETSGTSGTASVPQVPQVPQVVPSPDASVTRASLPAVAMIFATQTTIDSDTYARSLIARGVEASRIVSQACPGLADTISEDREGSETRSEIARWVNAAIGKMPDRNVPVVAALACTHYGYRRAEFAEAFRDAGVRAAVVNPNELAVHDIFPATRADEVLANRETEVSFVTRYVIPDATVEALDFFLAAIAPRTVAAMRSFTHVPDLF